MVANAYETLLNEVGKYLGVTLFPDQNNSCLVKLKNGVQVQLETDREMLRFLIGVNLGNIPMGRYRENLLREALKMNGLPHPRAGVFAFSPKSECLVLFKHLPIQELKGEQLALAIDAIAEIALVWMTAIQRGDIPAVSSAPARTPGLFGIRR